MYKCGKYIQNLGGVVPAAEELHLGVDDDPDGGAVLLHLLEKGNGGLAILFKRKIRH